jgi:hypothetical protein
MFSSQRRCAVALLALLPSIADSHTLCFASEVGSKSVRLQVTLPRDGSVTAFVRYERGSADIPAVRVEETAISPPGQLPATVRSTFAELVDGRRTGQYVLTTQGGSVGDLVYSRQGDTKAIVFYEDHQATTDVACDWSQRRTESGQK